jgi:hypothetical protein
MKKVSLFVCPAAALLLISQIATAVELTFSDQCGKAISSQEFSEKKSKYFSGIRGLMTAGRLLLETPYGDHVVSIGDTAVYSIYPVQSLQIYADLYNKVLPSQRSNTERVLSIQINSAFDVLDRMSVSMTGHTTLINNPAFLGEVRSVRSGLDDILKIISKNCAK